jgi:pyruvate kinase/thymidylate kinase
MTRIPEIMVTIGPTLEKIEDLCAATEAGARWFRLPCGYRQRPHVENAKAVRFASRECNIPVQLLLDLPSSRPRTGTMPDLKLNVGDRVVFYDSATSSVAPVEANYIAVPLPHLSPLLAKIEKGQRLWFCDGRLEFLAELVSDQAVFAHLVRGVIPFKTSNSLFLPDSVSPFKMVTEEDNRLLADLAENEITPDWIAFSLVSVPEDIVAGRHEIQSPFAKKVKVMAKIETAAAVDKAEAILSETDGLMVARGDLGPAVEFIRLPGVQKALVDLAQYHGKVVVVATQILEGFAETGVPPRAELAGLAELARQSPSVIMFGKETVYSPRPIECIQLAIDAMKHESNRLNNAKYELPRCLSSTLGQPLAVAIEGPNGTGKTHLCTLLRERLSLPYIRGIPSAWEHAEMKMHLIRDADWFASAMYFLSGVIESSKEIQHKNELLSVMDRSVWSTLAVHYAHDPKRMGLLMPLLELASGRIKVPDLTIVLEASPAVCRERIAHKSGLDQQYDAASPDTETFNYREREFYHWLATRWPKIIFIDSERDSIEEVYTKTEKAIREFLPCSS